MKNRGFLRWLAWIAYFVVLFILFAVIGREIGNGVFFVIAFFAVATVLFIKYYKGRKKDD